jgi:hypothetical protein
VFRNLVASSFVSVAAVLASSPAAFAADEGGRLDDSGARLLAERSGDRICQTLIEPDVRLRLRRCLLPAATGRIRTAYVDGQCDFGTRLFGIAPPGTRKVNLSGLGSRAPKPIRLRLFTIPRSMHPQGGVAFVVRRSLAGRSPVLTAYDAAGTRLTQRDLGSFAIAGCAPPPMIAQPE